MGIRAVGFGAHETAGGAVPFLAVLPFVIDLNEGKAEGLEFLRGELRELEDGFFVGRAAVRFRIPGAVAGRLRAKVDVVLPGNRVGEQLLPDARVVEQADSQRLQLCGLTGVKAQMAVIAFGS